MKKLIQWIKCGFGFHEIVACGKSKDRIFYTCLRCDFSEWVHELDVPHFSASIIKRSNMLQIIKTRPVKTPEYGTSESAGIDFFVPDDFGSKTLLINDSINIPSGIKTRFPHGKILVAFNKSGVSVKKRLQIGACVVDSDYEGEVHLHLFNTGMMPVTINAGDKIAQFILLDYNRAQIQEVQEFEQRETERGEGGFGSTNN